jgi:hypothetical protein
MSFIIAELFRRPSRSSQTDRTELCFDCLLSSSLLKTAYLEVFLSRSLAAQNLIFHHDHLGDIIQITQLRSERTKRRLHGGHFVGLLLHRLLWGCCSHQRSKQHKVASPYLRISPRHRQALQYRHRHHSRHVCSQLRHPDPIRSYVYVYRAEETITRLY